MANRTFNICENWGLYCFDMKQTEKGIRLNCALNGKKKEDGSYSKGVNVGVFCAFPNENGEGGCDIEPDDYSGGYIDVWGGISASEYTDKDGVVRASLTIFADKVRKHDWGDNQ